VSSSAELRARLKAATAEGSDLDRDEHVERIAEVVEHARRRPSTAIIRDLFGRVVATKR
jgi:hypothetical protein